MAAVPITSLEAYRSVLESGALGEMQEHVYRWIYDHQSEYQVGVSQDDIRAAHAHEDDSRKYGKRFHELERMGLIAFVGEKKNHGGRAVRCFRTTGARTPCTDTKGAALLELLDKAIRAVSEANLSPQMSLARLRAMVARGESGGARDGNGNGAGAADRVRAPGAGSGDSDWHGRLQSLFAD